MRVTPWMLLFVACSTAKPSFQNPSPMVDSARTHERLQPLQTAGIRFALSGVLAAFAAWHTARVSNWYFRIFGLMYGFDGLVGMLIFLARESAFVAVAANLPHVAIAVIALRIGFQLPRDGA